MVEDYCGIAEIFVRDVHETLYSDRAPPKAIAWDHARLSIKFGVNQADTVVHIHRTGRAKPMREI